MRIVYKETMVDKITKMIDGAGGRTDLIDYVELTTKEYNQFLAHEKWDANSEVLFIMYKGKKVNIGLDR